MARRSAILDPYWTVAVFADRCVRCGEPINKGARVFRYPASKVVYYCAKDGCGGQESRNFATALFDERGF
jgi:hypothetical protein